MRQIFLAGKEAQKRTPLHCSMLPNRPAQHRISSFQRIKYRSLGDRTFDFDRYLVPDVCEGPQMLWKFDSNRYRHAANDPHFM